MDATAPQTPPPRKATARVLVVEDDHDARELLGLVLKRAGYAVDGAEDGAVGLRLFDTQDYDIVIADVMMPEMTGLDLCRRVRQAGGYVPLLLVSALGMPDDKAAGYDVGADAYLTKPLYARELLARVQWALQLKARHDTLSRAADQAEDAGSFQRRLTDAGEPPPGLAVHVRPVGRAGGDLVHVTAGDAGKGWTIFLSDSCGHDLTAGVSAVAVRALLAREDFPTDPGRALVRLNQALGRMLTPDHFVTGVLAVWDPAKKTLAYAAAGHPAPLVANKNGSRQLPAHPSYPLGISREAGYTTRHRKLKRGDRVLFFSDGLPESQDAAGRPYDLARAGAAIAAADGSEDAIRRVLADLDAFRGGAPADDDLSLVAATII